MFQEEDASVLRQKRRTTCLPLEFLGLLKAWKGNQDFVTWIAKFEIVLKRVRNSWMDLLPEVNPEDQNPEFLAALTSLRDQEAHASKAFVLWN